MATVTSSFVIKPTVIPWQTLPGADIFDSSIPRAELRYTVDGLGYTPGVGDVVNYSMNATLPKNYAYALTDVFARTKQANATDPWNPQALLQFTDSSNLSGTGQDGEINIPVGLSCPGGFLSGTGVQRTQVFTADKLPKMLMGARFNQEEISFSLTLSQLVSGTVDFNVFLRFLQYDIAQVNAFESNTPILTR